MRDWLSHRVVSSPDDTALIRAEDGEKWTYAELDRLVSETAGRLAAHGIGPGDHLGVLMPAYVGAVGLAHAAMRLGATYVPLGERLTPRELSDRIDRADLTVLVCGESTESDAVAATDDVPVLSVDEPTTGSVRGVHDADPIPIDPPEWTFEDRLCLLFTSGSTGGPKPVELTAGNVYASAVASAFRLGVDPDDRWLVSISLHHMGGLAPIYRSTLYGTTVVLREEFDPGRTADDIDAYDVTGVSLVPTMLKRTLDRRGTLADSLRVVLLGGASAPNSLIERCRNYSIPVYPTYGMTEAASQIATATPTQTFDRPGTVGRPLFGTDLTIVSESGEPVDPGDAGEIVVDGPTITPGYYGMPETTDVAFGEYGLHTGDIGRIDDEGNLYVLNRLDDQIVSGGENVDPGEVFEALSDHPAVADAAVVGLEDDVWGERVAALLVADADAISADASSTAEFVDGPDVGADANVASEPIDGSESDSDPDISVDDDQSDTGDGSDTDGSETSGTDAETEHADSERLPEPAVDEAELFSFLREQLAGFKLPRTIAFTDDLPRTVSGTIDRSAVRSTLRERGYEPKPVDRGFSSAGFEPADPEPVTGRDADADDPVEEERSDSGDEGTEPPVSDDASDSSVSDDASDSPAGDPETGRHDR